MKVVNNLKSALLGPLPNIWAKNFQIRKGVREKPKEGIGGDMERGREMLTGVFGRA